LVAFNRSQTLEKQTNFSRAEPTTNLMLAAYEFPRFIFCQFFVIAHFPGAAVGMAAATGKAGRSDTGQDGAAR
jgi:hypothetical protein